MRSHFLSLLIPIPAIIASVFLMLSADVGKMVWLQQILVTAVSLLLCAFAFRRAHGVVANKPISTKTATGVMLASLFLLMLPLLIGNGVGPQRWLRFAGVGLYIASCVLPLLLLIIAVLLDGRHLPRSFVIGIYSVVGVSLALQPDASQITAFTIASMLTLGRAALPVSIRLLALSLLLACTVWAWLQPDLLQPVSYVEGVIQLAFSIGMGMMMLAVACALCIPLGLLWLARSTQRPELVSVAVYYMLISGFAYAQLTPMPLLGFGAGPILGYFLMVWSFKRTSDFL